MSWYCEYCSGENGEDTYTCEHCGYEYYNEAGYYDENAYDENGYYTTPYDANGFENGDHEYDEGDAQVPKFKTFRKKSVCENCYHKHYEGEYCHVFIEKEIVIDDEDGEDDETSDNGDFSGSDGDISIKEEEEEDNSALRQDQKLLGTKKEEVVAEPLTTPELINKCGFERCNCNIGIPAGDTSFVPLPKPYYVEDIKVLTYEFQSGEAPKDLMGHAYDRNIEKLNKAIADFMPTILQFIPFSLCASAAITCSSWNTGANMYGEYIDIRNCIPWQVYRPHAAQVDAVIVIGRRAFSGGDRRVYVSDVDTGETLHQVTRDTGDIPLLMPVDESIFCCSSNGAIRVFALMHNVKRIHLELTMWEHSRRVTHILFSDRSNGNCATHGIENHICHMYTASEDRSIRIWDLNKHIPIKTIRPKMIRHSTVQALALSDRHLLAATTGGTVMVFSLHNICERDDVHNCLVAVEEAPKGADNVGVVKDGSPEAVDRAFCLQIILRLPSVSDGGGNIPSINTIICSGASHTRSHLFAGDSTGRLTIWKIPSSGLDFAPEKTWKPHKRGLVDMKHTANHLITAGEDGCIVLHSLDKFAKIRNINILDWAVDRGLVFDESSKLPRMLTCMCLVEDHDNGGTLVVGTSYGELIVLGIGTHI